MRVVGVLRVDTAVLARSAASGRYDLVADVLSRAGAMWFVPAMTVLRLPAGDGESPFEPSRSRFFAFDEGPARFSSVVPHRDDAEGIRALVPMGHTSFTIGERVARWPATDRQPTLEDDAPASLHRQRPGDVAGCYVAYASDGQHLTYAAPRCYGFDARSAAIEAIRARRRAGVDWIVAFVHAVIDWH
jgi:hypothetical protein